MSRMPQKHNQNIMALCKCNTVYNLQQNGISRKTLISQIVQKGVTINYANSQTATVYNTILSLDYVSNKKLLLLLKYKLYMKYLNQLISCGKYNAGEIYSMIDYIIANLTPAEYKLVFDIKDAVEEVVAAPVVISKTFYVTVDINRDFFLIQNYNGEYLLPYISYEFNLEHPSNVNTKFSLSSYKNNIEVSGIVYTGIPGTPGSKLVYTVPGNTSYAVYIFNSFANDPYSWGYAQPLIPILSVNQVHSFSSYIPLIMNQISYLSVYYNTSLRFLIQSSFIDFNTSVNYIYMFYYGTYYIEVPKIYSLALLNKGQEDKIQYIGDINKSTTSDIIGTVNDGSYNFYYDTLTISIYEPFTPVSLYSQLYGYLGAIKSIVFDSSAASSAKPEIRIERKIDVNSIETLYGQTKVIVDYSNNKMSLNNNSNNTSTATSYGVYNGTYIFYSDLPITFLNKTKEDIFIVSGLNGLNGVGPDGITNYIFYSGIIQVKILGDFYKMSIYTNKGYCGGLYILNYGSIYDTYLPHSYEFTNIIKNTLFDPPVITYTNSILLNPTNTLFTSSYLQPVTTYNIINKDANNNLIFNNISYNSTNQFIMKKGTYIFYNISGLFLTFMTNNKPVKSIGDNTGFFFTSAYSPNGDPYIFNKSQITSVNFITIYFSPITVTVTDNFGYLSICTPTGYNGGQNRLSWAP